FNLFMANVRKQYGKVSYVRVWEAHKSGFPHIHVLLIFHEHRFRSYLWNGEHRLKVEKKLEKYWPHGINRWRGVYEVKGALKYLSKYMTKALNFEVEGSEINLFKLWVYEKRTFAVSRRLDITRDNSNLIEERLDGSCVLVESTEEVWESICVANSMVDFTKQDIIKIKPIQCGWYTIHRITYSRKRAL
ncbi:unnamed protein product, partial [marine sediment metagenome]